MVFWVKLYVNFQALEVSQDDLIINDLSVLFMVMQQNVTIQAKFSKVRRSDTHSIEDEQI